MKKDLVVVALLDELNIGDTFAKWPLHLTILPWFSYHKLDGFLDQIKEVVQETEQVEVRIGMRTMWGGRVVSLTQYSVALHRLHDQLLKIAINHGRIRHTGNEFTGRSYTPHITHQGHHAVHEGQKIMIKNVYIIESGMSRHVKTVVGKIDLKS